MFCPNTLNESSKTHWLEPVGLKLVRLLRNSNRWPLLRRKCGGINLCNSFLKSSLKTHTSHKPIIFFIDLHYLLRAFSLYFELIFSWLTLLLIDLLWHFIFGFAFPHIKQLRSKATTQKRNSTIAMIYICIYTSLCVCVI